MTAFKEITKRCFCEVPQYNKKLLVPPIERVQRSSMARCRWRGKSPSPARGYRVAKDLIGIQPAHGWSMGPSGARKLLGHGIAKGEGTLPCEWCRRRYACDELETAQPYASMLRVSETVHLAGGDATGNAPAGAPCQAVWYYHTQLAVKAKRTGRRCRRTLLCWS